MTASEWPLVTRLREGRTNGSHLRWQVGVEHREAADRIAALEVALRDLTTNRMHDFLCHCAEDWENEHAAFERAKRLIER